jgi:hypothetical protein
MQFEIKEHSPVVFSNFNARVEKHGSESVPAADLSFTMDAPNSVLGYFADGLLEALYCRTEASESDQDELEGVEPITNMPTLRFPGLAPQKLDKKMPGYTLNIDYGLGGDSCIDIIGCEVGKFVLDLKEGGTITVKFQVQCQTGLTEQIMGKLAMLNGQELKIQLLAPVVKQATTEVGGNPFPMQGEKDKPLTAEQVFLQGADVQDTAAVH